MREIAPSFATDDIRVAAWEPDSGYADPCGTTYGFTAAALKRRAELWTPAVVMGISVKDGKIRGVETDKGIISTRVVVNAAGAYAARVTAMAGCSVPVVPIRYQAGVFRRPLELEVPHPTIIDRLLGQFYFRPDSAGHTVVGGIGALKNVDPESYNESTDLDYPNRARAVLARRMPGMERAIFRGGRTACDGYSQDEYAILDRMPEVEGFYCAIGHTGHGFKIAPAVGICMAELITEGRAKTVDITPFRYSRFAEGVNPFTNPNLYDERGQ